MHRIPLTLARIVHRHPVMLVAATMLVATGLAFGIPQIEFRTGQDTLLDPGSKIAMDNARFQSQFGGDPMLVLFEMQCTADEGRPADSASGRATSGGLTAGGGLATSSGGSSATLVGGAQSCPTIEHLFARGNRAELARLEAELTATGNYHSIISPLSILQLAAETIERRMISEPAKLAEDEAAAMADARAASAARGESPEQQEAAALAAKQRVDDAFQAEFGADAARFLAISERTLDNPDFVRFVMYGPDGELRPQLGGIFPDEEHALMVVRLKGNLTIDEGSAVAADIRDGMDAYTFDGVAPLVSGPPLLIKEINDKMRSALVVMAVFAVVIMAAVLFVVFRARWRLLSLPAVLVGCVAAFGLMGFLGIPLTMVTISGLPILIGLGVDFAIQAHSRIEEETFAADSAEIGIDRTFARLGPALGLAVVAAGIGFLVLHLSEVPMIRDFGSMLAVGAVMVFAISIALISGVLYLRERTRLGPQPAPVARIEVERIVSGITTRTVGRLAPIALIALAVAAVGLYVSQEIPTQTDPEKFVPSDSKVLDDLDHVRQVTGSTSELNLLIEVPDGGRVTDQATLDWILAFEEDQKRQHPELQRSNSVASFTKSVTGDDPTTASAEEALDLAPAAIRDSVVNADRTMASITFAISDGASLDDRRAITDAIEREAQPPAGVTVAPAGIAVVGSAAVDAISGNRDLMSFVAVGAILLVLLAAYRNIVKAVAPLLPVLFALGASAMMIYFAGIEYSPLTSISGPLIIAMGTEFNILLMARYFEERAAGVEPRAAIGTASMRIGRAIMASGLTVMGGFAVLAFSDFPLLDNFGKVTALNIGLSLLSTLILLPPLLVWADEDRHLLPVPAEPATLRIR